MSDTSSYPWDELAEFHAYDSCGPDFGKHNPARKKECLESARQLQRTEDAFRLSFSRWVRDQYLSEEALAEGYGYEDVANFALWLEENGVYP